MKKWKQGLFAAALAAPAFGQQDREHALEKAQAALARIQVQTVTEAQKIEQVELDAVQRKLEQLAPLAPIPPESLASPFAFAKADALRAGLSFQIRSGNGSYDGGTRALDDRRYEDAIRNFDAVINTKAARADGALYWKAYALDKAGRRDEALAAIAKLRQDYPQSRWLNDAQALEGVVKQGSGQPGSAASETNDDLKLMAINSLMNADPERAVPLLEGVLKGNSAPKVKERALFVLTQSKAPRALQLLGEYARGAGNPDMQIRALRYLGMSATPDARQQLLGIYGSASDTAVKREILRSLMTSNATEQIFTLARNEKEPELRIEAIRQLGAMRAANELMQLYGAESSTDNRVAIVRSLMVAGAGDKLLELARSEKDPRVRTEAIRNAAHNRSTSAEALLQLYAGESDLKLRRELVNGLANRGEVKMLVDLARRENDPAMKKMIVERLATSRSKEATDYMMELLK